MFLFSKYVHPCHLMNTGDYARYAIMPTSITPHFLLFTIVYFFFFSSSFLFFSFLLLLVIYVHSRVSRGVVSGVHFFFAGLYSHGNTPESWIWPPWIHFTRVSAHAMSLLNIEIKFGNELFLHYR